ncbi:15-cis-phytoene synthase [Methylacidimicrobium cyclopophantes]|uniref:15-cis-phytoene synthase n=1 Tax=Methylacidimicrobium cyclopophantes TaxID=1041766 RepID=A0A5E6MIH7_9BACT|nr:squalene synthase HpnC [Methylacidimicrobium cyclopophantes]VVM05301.1 15-cis-phytoene synthase [Methylacidimicrobium cyclopophantes]
MTLETAYAACRRIARHYENFPVGLLISPPLRPHIHAIYAFARLADDIADEGYDGSPAGPIPPERTVPGRLAALRHFEEALRNPEDAAEEPVFVALHDTIRRFDLPIQLFLDLLSAFAQDVEKRRYASFAEVSDYCRRSANPIGRLVLLIHGQRREEQLAASDSICTALQVTNFWQDLSVDLLKDRIYLPEDEMAEFGVSEESLFARCAGPAFRRLLAMEVERAFRLFDGGYGLMKTLSSPLRWEIELTWHSGRRILEKIVDLAFDTLHYRPTLGVLDAPTLLAKAFFRIRDGSSAMQPQVLSALRS